MVETKNSKTDQKEVPRIILKGRKNFFRNESREPLFILKSTTDKTGKFSSKAKFNRSASERLGFRPGTKVIFGEFKGNLLVHKVDESSEDSNNAYTLNGSANYYCSATILLDELPNGAGVYKLSKETCKIEKQTFHIFEHQEPQPEIIAIPAQKPGQLISAN